MPGSSILPDRNSGKAHHRYSAPSPAALLTWQIQQLQAYTASYPILISDDETMSRTFYRSLFQHHALTSLDTRDSREVLSICQQCGIGLVLSDIEQPYMSGLAMLHELRQHPNTANIPVVFVSGSSDQRENALRAGADGFLSKPCHPNLILQEIWCCWRDRQAPTDLR